jgi:hypothetical protein
MQYVNYESKTEITWQRGLSASELETRARDLLARRDALQPTTAGGWARYQDYSAALFLIRDEQRRRAYRSMNL